MVNYTVSAMSVPVKKLTDKKRRFAPPGRGGTKMELKISSIHRGLWGCKFPSSLQRMHSHPVQNRIESCKKSPPWFVKGPGFLPCPQEPRGHSFILISRDDFDIREIASKISVGRTSRGKLPPVQVVGSDPHSRPPPSLTVDHRTTSPRLSAINLWAGV